MNDKFILLVDSILCFIMSIIFIIYGFINWGEEHTALYFAIGFVCAILVKVIVKQTNSNKEHFKD